jgi:hypothetical protein
MCKLQQVTYLTPYPGSMWAFLASCFLLLMRQMLIKLSGLFELQQTGLLDF